MTYSADGSSLVCRGEKTLAPLRIGVGRAFSSDLFLPIWLIFSRGELGLLDIRFDGVLAFPDSASPVA